MATKVKETKISDLIPDDLNANKHTEYGMSILEKSVSQLGLGRSILVDKNNRIIAGNGVTETAANLNLDEVIIVETDGTRLVAVKRMDIDIDSKQGRELAIADNATAKANIAWDEEAIQQIAEQWEIAPESWGIKPNDGENDPVSEWVGMPEYEVEDQSGVKDLIIHFKTMEDYQNFAKLVGQNLSEKTKSIWYPEIEK